MKVNRIKELNSFSTIELMKWFNKVSVEKLSNLIVKEKEYKKYRTLKWNTIVYTKLKTNKEGLLDIITQYAELGREEIKNEEPVITLKEHSEGLRKMQEATKKLYEAKIRGLKRRIDSMKSSFTEEDKPKLDRMYKDLMKMYHTDRGGDLEMAQFVNSKIKPLRG